ncbi:MAG: hypothetical protein CL840_02855 [Crocinitomicaceae bacterium]|nr:hypothetical protein [Crocinitomicaceae bacterium]|tara:strand:+ start:42629 stop:43249 length:621 start_codon:yes stop_codon:yes gene_type:complete
MMLRLWISSFLILVCTLSISAQQGDNKKFHAGVKLGANTSQMTGDGFAGFYKFSVVGGVFANTAFNEKMKMQYEIIYQGKGSHKPAKPDEGIYDSYKIRLNYIEVPVLFQYKIEKFELEIGPGFGFLLGSKEWDQNGLRTGSSNDWRVFELDAMFGVNYFFTDHFFVNARTHHSVTSVVTTTAVTPYGVYGGAWNIVLALTLNYQF